MAKQKAAKSKTEGKTWTVEANQDAYAKFVATWQGADSVDEVVKASGMVRAKVASWSYRLRKAGIALKKFKTKPELDIKALNEIAKKSLKSN